MTLQEHSVEEVKIPEIEPEITTLELLKRFLSEATTALRAEIGLRKKSLKPGERDLVLAYEHLELAGMYVERSEDMNPYEVMRVMKMDIEETKKLFKRTHPELD